MALSSVGLKPPGSLPPSPGPVSVRSVELEISRAQEENADPGGESEWYL